MSGIRSLSQPLFVAATTSMNIIRDLLWLLFVNIKYDTVQHVGWYSSRLI